MVDLGYLPPLAEARPTHPRATWALDELGATEPLVPGFEPFSQPNWLVWTITAVTFASFSLLMAGLLRRACREQAFFWWLILGHVLLFALLWLLFDRYLLSLVPVFMVLLLNSSELRSQRLAVVLVSVTAVYSLIGVRDHLSYNRALWQAVDEMERLGVPISETDGGYVVNGWRQYAHPKNAPRDPEGGVAVPMMNVKSILPYVIANGSLRGYRVIRSIPYRRWLGRSRSIYLLERDLHPD
jgi:hypothetical protein